MQARWTSCPFTCIHPRRLACGILQPIATQDPPFIPSNWWHPSYTNGYQYGWYPSPSKSAPATWMPEPAPMLNCPPGLEYLGQVLHTNPNCFLMKYDLGDPTRRNEKLKRVGKG